VYILPALLIVHAITFWGRGIIDREAAMFVVKYQEDRPLLAKIFDPNANDGGYYQARELSYVFDLVDAKVFRALLERRILLFIPVSGAIGLVVVAAIYVRGARRLPLDHVTAALLLSLFLSCIVTQASTPILYRSSKILLSAALLAFLLDLSLLVARNERATLGQLTGLFLLGIVMPACDRQGFYYLTIATGIVVTLWLAATLRAAPARINHVPIIVVSLCAIAIATFYDTVAAPMIIHWANGYWPDFSYQELQIGRLYTERFVANRAWQMFRAQAGYFFGNAPFAPLAVILLAACVASTWHRRSIEVPIIALLSSASLFVLLGLMVLRHPPVYFIPDHSFHYYTLTLHVVFLFGITLLVSSLDGAGGGTAAKLAMSVLLLLMIANNVRNYPAQRAIMVDSPGYLKRQYGRSQKFSDDFAATRADHPSWPPAWLLQP